MTLFITEDAEQRCVKQKILRLRGRQSNPPGGKDALNVSMAKERDIPRQRAEMGNEAVGTGRDLGGRLAVPEEVSAGARCENIGGGSSLVPF